MPAVIRGRSTRSQGELLFDPQAPRAREAPPSPLTATILFMASSLRESLLVSSISFRSSCLVGDTRGQLRAQQWGWGYQSVGSRQKEGTWAGKAGLNQKGRW